MATRTPFHVNEKMSDKIVLQVQNQFRITDVGNLILKSYPRKLQQLISNLNIQKMPLFIKNVNAMLIAFIVLVLKSWLELRPSFRNSSLQRNFN